MTGHEPSLAGEETSTENQAVLTRELGGRPVLHPDFLARTRLFRENAEFARFGLQLRRTDAHECPEDQEHDRGSDGGHC